MQSKIIKSLRFVFSQALLLSFFLLAACQADVEETVSEPVIRPVKTQVLTVADDVRVSQYPALITAGQSAELAFQSGGLLQELLVKPAQEVNKGDTIAKLDTRDFQSQLTSAKAQYQSAQEEYQRALRLSKEDAIAKSAVEQRRSKRDVAKAQLDSASKALQDAVLIAPFTGSIATVPVEQLQTVSAGQTVVTMLTTNELEATVNLPASVIITIEQRKDKKAQVILDAMPNTPIAAEFKEADLQADTASQTYAVTFSFTPPENLAILPGMNASMVLSSNSGEQQTNFVAVPLAAIMAVGDKKMAWVVDPETMTLSSRDVTVADGVGELIVITKGLQAGDTIVTAGVTSLSEGMKVRPWQSQ